MQTAFERRTTMVLDELLKVAQAVVLIGIFAAAGKAFDSPLAYAAAGLLYVVTCFYVGVRVDSLVAFARYLEVARRHTVWDLILGMAATAAFATWMIVALHAVLQHEGLS